MILPPIHNVPVVSQIDQGFFPYDFTRTDWDAFCSIGKMCLDCSGKFIIRNAYIFFTSNAMFQCIPRLTMLEMMREKKPFPGSEWAGVPNSVTTGTPALRALS